jgi:hypothetical protein
MQLLLAGVSGEFGSCSLYKLGGLGQTVEYQQPITHEYFWGR